MSKTKEVDQSVEGLNERQLKSLYKRNQRYLSAVKQHPMVEKEMLEQQELIKTRLLQIAKNKVAISHFLSEQLTIDTCRTPDPVTYEKKVIQWLKGEYAASVSEMNYCKKRSEDKRLYAHNLPNNISSYSQLGRVSGGESLSKSEQVLIRLEERCDEYLARYLELKMKVEEMDKILDFLSVEQLEVIQIKYIVPFIKNQRELSDDETIANLPYEKTLFYEKKYKLSALSALASKLGYI